MIHGGQPLALLSSLLSTSSRPSDVLQRVQSSLSSSFVPTPLSLFLFCAFAPSCSCSRNTTGAQLLLLWLSYTIPSAVTSPATLLPPHTSTFARFLPRSSTCASSTFFDLFDRLFLFYDISCARTFSFFFFFLMTLYYYFTGCKQGN